jgi:hypothetical protein
MDLAQMSPDFAKNVRSLITRVNEKKPKSKKTSDYMPPTVEEGEEEEEEILTTEVTIESNMTNINLQSYATTNSIANTTANSTDLPVSRELSHDCENPRIEPIHPKTPSKLVAKSKPLISQPLPVSPENNSLIPANEALQLKANLVNLHGGVPYKSLGGKKRTTFTQNDYTGITQKDRHNSAIPTPFHRDRIKLQTGYLATEYKQQLLAY